jgi:hypothetical protein
MILKTIYFSPEAEAPAAVMPQGTQAWASRMADGLPSIPREEPPVTTETQPTNTTLVVEAPVATDVPATTTAGDTPIYTEDENKSWLESFMNPKPVEQSTQIETTQNVSQAAAPEAGKEPQTDDARYQEYIQKAQAYEQLTSSDTFKALDEFIRSGKSDPLEFLSERIGSNPSNLTPIQLKEISLKELGLTAEEITEELDEFKELSPAKQKVQTAPILENLTNKRNEKLKAFSANHKPTQQIDHEEQSRYQGVLKATLTTLDDKIENSLRGKKYDELLITPAMADNIKAEVMQNSYPVYDKQGKITGYNLDKAISAAVFGLYGSELKKAFTDRAILAGYDAVIKSRNNPSKEGAATGGVIPTQSDAQKLADATDKAYTIKKRL